MSRLSPLTSSPCPRSADHAGGGFSITELLVYVALGALVAAGAAVSVVTNIRTASNLELRQRAVDDFGRLNFFLHSEISEGKFIEYSTTAPLPAGCGPGQRLFSIVLPNPTNPAAFPNREPLPRIHYYTRNGGIDLWRCGPSIDANGRLELVSAAGTLLQPLDARVNTNTILTTVNNTDPLALSYTVALRSPSGVVTLQRGSAANPLVARTGVRAIE